MVPFLERNLDHFDITPQKPPIPIPETKPLRYQENWLLLKKTLSNARETSCNGYQSQPEHVWNKVEVLGYETPRCIKPSLIHSTPTFSVSLDIPPAQRFVLGNLYRKHHIPRSLALTNFPLAAKVRAREEMN